MFPSVAVVKEDGGRKRCPWDWDWDDLQAVVEATREVMALEVEERQSGDLMLKFAETVGFWQDELCALQAQREANVEVEERRRF